MYIISKNFKKNWWNYLWQSFAAGLITAISIYIFSGMVGLFILAGVGSTFFTIFALPHNRTSRMRNIIGSYIISISFGILAFKYFPSYMGGGLAVGMATFLMVVTDSEHPPAAGIALGLALVNSVDIAIRGTIFALMGAALSAFFHYLLKPLLKDLF